MYYLVLYRKFADIPNDNSEYSKSSFIDVNRFCDFKGNDI